jgi:predicted permease
MIEEMLDDMRRGALGHLSRPGPTTAVVLSLALGIGANTALFSVVNAVLLRSSPVASPDRLVEIYSSASADYPQLTTSYPDYLDVERGADAFSGLAAAGLVRGILASKDRAELVTGEVATANYFRVMGIAMALGSDFAKKVSGSEGLDPVVILSHALWIERFEGRASVVGERVTLSGHPYTVVGVAPAGVNGTLPGIPVDFWAPIGNVDRFVFSGVQWTADQEPGTPRPDRLDQRGSRWLFVKGRLGPNRTLGEARIQLETIFARLEQAYKATNEKVRPTLLPAAGIRFHPMLDGYFKAAGAGSLVAVGLVLLIACANVANLLLARGVARRQEIAIRAALGASRARLARQMLSESLVLVLAAGALGVFLAWWGGRALSGLGTDAFPVPVRFDFSIDVTVLAFASCACLLAALISCLIPAWSSSGTNLVPALRDQAGPSSGAIRFSAMSVLVTGQLSLALVLLVSGTLLGRGLVVARRIDPGYDARHLSSFSFNLQMNGYDIERATSLRDRALQLVREMPTVRSASVASRLPLSPDVIVRAVHVPGYHTAPGDQAVVDAVSVGADYFVTVGVPIVRGRSFSTDDIAQQRRVVIVNETMAHKFWPGGRPLGGLLHLGGPETAPLEVVGVARDHKVRSVGEVPRPYLHLPIPPSQEVGLVVSTTVPAETALNPLRQTLWSLDPGIVFTEDAPAAQVAAETMAPTRIGAVAVGAFGTLGLLLAAVGLYGVTGYSLSLRTREIGIRMALGASRAQVLQMILAESGRLVAAGVIIGAAGSAVAGRFLTSMLYGVGAFDPWAGGLAVLVLGSVTLAASLRAAWAASRIDPGRALRTD